MAPGRELIEKISGQYQDLWVKLGRTWKLQTVTKTPFQKKLTHIKFTLILKVIVFRISLRLKIRILISLRMLISYIAYRSTRNSICSICSTFIG